MANKLIVSSSPHSHSKTTTSKIMWTVFASLIPAAGYSVYLFGIPAISVIVSTIIFSVVLEELGNYLLKKRSTFKDGSAALTGLLLALTLPPGVPLWICFIGAFVSITVAKTVFGGLGQNPFNPALTGRVFLLIAFPVPLTRWLVPTGTGDTLFGQSVSALNSVGAVVPFGSPDVDAVTAATPLGLLAEGGKKAVELLSHNSDIFIGQMNGSLGETSGILLLLGGAFLIYKKIISWHIPLSFLGAMAVFAGITNIINPDKYADIPFHLFTGGAIIGAFFMATDYVTSPTFSKGKLIFGAGAGLLTMIIRIYGGYPEGVSFAILLMNATVPLIDGNTKPKKFGFKKIDKNGAQNA
ncbi:MAG: RnfABCDGE type electron transport complex subunit D [Deltaproteobacteria bacterium]|nr:RnfABCDGE type electron transport complex subunit D [Deltaproteobacteria bacterium]